MALFKLKQGLLGGQVEGSYWKIVNVTISTFGAGPYLATIALGLFKDKSASDSLAPPLMQKKFEVIVSKSDLDSQNLVGFFYNKIKSQPSSNISAIGRIDTDIVDAEDV